MDLTEASAQIDTLIERRASQKDKANELEEMWARSELAHRERLQRENAAAWYSFHMLLAENHAAISEQHRVKAEALLEEPGEGTRKRRKEGDYR